MAQASALVQDMRAFVSAADPNTLVQNGDFQKKCDALPKKLAAMVGASRMRFDEPWGIMPVVGRGLAQTAYAKAATQKLTIERGSRSALAASKG